MARDSDRYIGGSIAFIVTAMVFFLAYMSHSFTFMSVFISATGMLCIFEISKPFVLSNKKFNKLQAFYVSLAFVTLGAITFISSAMMGYIGIFSVVGFIFYMFFINRLFTIMFSYVVIAICFALWSGNLNILLLCVVIACVSDISGFTIGRLVGGIKPIKISKNKTLSGFVGSIVCGTILGGIFFMPNIKHSVSYLYGFYFSFLLTMMAILGDLFCSYYKRRFKIKDYGSIVIGHGGVMDRMDSILATFLMLPTLTLVTM